MDGANRLGLDAVIGSAKNIMQIADMGMHAAMRLGHGLIDPIPGKVLHQDRRHPGRLRYHDAHRRNITHHQAAVQGANLLRQSMDQDRIKR